LHLAYDSLHKLRLQLFFALDLEYKDRRSGILGTRPTQFKLSVHQVFKKLFHALIAQQLFPVNTDCHLLAQGRTKNG
jgi:hypothetical protein